MRERHGDGACIVLRDQESWLHGEGWQGLSQHEGGVRDAPKPQLIRWRATSDGGNKPGEPYAVKVARTVRGRAIGKGLRHLESTYLVYHNTSLIAYSTERCTIQGDNEIYQPKLGM